ncbi:hypothetical protein [Streptomyces chartreusis]|uniref:hypothetical protein n=1 Tax=Streptomyces chartreusis TaxID=1969 RepID=UPI0036A39FEA
MTVQNDSRRNDDQRSWWQRVRRTCVITAALMGATYWTLRVIEAAVHLHEAVSPWV